MRILHVSCEKKQDFSGVSRIVPIIVDTQKELIESGNDSVDYVNLRESRLDRGAVKGYDLVVFHEVFYPAFLKVSRECRKCRVPYIIVPHGCLTRRSLQKKKLKKQVGLFLLFDRFVRNAEALQMLSDNESSETVYDLKKFVCGTGVEIPQKRKEYPSEENTDREIRITFIGRVCSYQKGLDTLVRAVDMEASFLRENHAVLFIYGPDEDNSVAALNRQIEDSHINDLVKICEPVYGEEKEEILLNSDMFILTSPSEGLPVGMIEALSYGVPCIASAGTGLTEAINRYDAGWGEKNGTEAERNGAENISSLIKTAISERSLWPQKSENALRLVRENFEKNKAAEKMLEQYRKYGLWGSTHIVS